MAHLYIRNWGRDMAIYHLHAQIIQRSKGRCTTAAIAYRRGALVHDQRLGKTFDYRGRSGVDHTDTLAPQGAPDWVFEPEILWNEVERVERRKDAQLAREIDIALPVELSPSDQIALAKRFVRLQFVSLGMVADMAFHGLETHNPHVHIMLTLRELRPDGFGKKKREWNSRKRLRQWRSAWSEICNRALEALGSNARIDHRTLLAQGLPRHPQIHLGPATAAMMRRGIQTDRGHWYRMIHEQNRRIDQLREKISELSKIVFRHFRELLKSPGGTLAITELVRFWRDRLQKLSAHLESEGLSPENTKDKLRMLDRFLYHAMEKVDVPTDARNRIPKEEPDPPTSRPAP